MCSRIVNQVLLTELLLLVDELHTVLARSLLQFTLQSGVVVILDMIVGATGKVLCNFRPPIAVNFVQLEDLLVFFCRPLNLLDVRIQVVMPSIKAIKSS